MSERISGLRASVLPADTMKLQVAEPGFLLKRLGADCDPLQYLRELTQNAVEAGATTIQWDVDWQWYEQTGVYKLCLVDNGRGMTGAELVRYINQLASSGGVQALDGNFGLGAKIATATGNPAGVVYRSWQDGVGSMVWLWSDPQTGMYGLRPFELPDGSYDYVMPLGPDEKPDLIDRHGTKVTLLGDDTTHDTMAAPEGAPTPSSWLARHLNARYFDLPEHVDLRTREGWRHTDEGKRRLRRVHGMREFLTRHSENHGIVKLRGCRVRWWLLSDSDDRRNDPRVPRGGHVAALYQGELYDLATGRSGTARLQMFGMLFGAERVVLYVEPTARRRVTANTARTELRFDQAELPYARWAQEFRKAMPEALSQFLESFTASSISRDSSVAIANRLGSMGPLYRLSPFSPPRIAEQGEPEATNEGGDAVLAPGHELPRRDAATATGEDAGVCDDAPRMMVGRRRRTPSEASIQPPHVVWISQADGTRSPDWLEDRAAHFDPDRDLLQINADFRGFTDMIAYWCKQYGIKDREHPVIVAVVREWFELNLVDVIIGCRALQGQPCWTSANIAAATSEEALTAVVLARYHTFVCIKRALGTRMGALG